jgi:hypothetical protein
VQHPSAEFLAALFGPNGPPKNTYAQLWDATRSYTHNLQSWHGAAAVVLPGSTRDVYVAAGLSERDTGHGRRLKQDECAGIGGLWLDVDVIGGPSERRSGAPDKGAAADLAGSISEPSILVDSGYGVQAWWLLEEPWLFSDTDERTAARRLEAACVERHRRAAGWRVDSVHDLARLMRLPGTINGKDRSDPRLVSIIHNAGTRYRLEQLREVFGEHEPGPASMNGAQVSIDFELGASSIPHVKFAALYAESPSFAATFEERSRRQIGGAWTASECDMSLASYANHAGWQTDEIAALLYEHRRLHHPEGLDKALRGDYVARTISKASAKSAREARQAEASEQQAEALQELAEASADPAPATGLPSEERARRWELFNRAVFGDRSDQRFVRLLQQGRGRQAVFTLHTEADDEVEVGSPRDMLNPDRFAEALLGHVGHSMLPVKREHWRDSLGAVMQLVEVTEHADETQRGRTLSAINAYLAQHVGMEPDEAKLQLFPFRESRDVLLNITHLLAWCRRMDLVERGVHVNTLAKELQAIGFRHERQSAYTREGKRVQPWYYRASASALE